MDWSLFISLAKFVSFLSDWLNSLFSIAYHRFVLSCEFWLMLVSTKLGKNYFYFSKIIGSDTINRNQTWGDYSSCHVILHTKGEHTFFPLIILTVENRFLFLFEHVKNIISLWCDRLCFRISTLVIEWERIKLPATNTSNYTCKWSTFRNAQQILLTHKVPANRNECVWGGLSLLLMFSY